MRRGARLVLDDGLDAVLRHPVRDQGHIVLRRGGLERHRETRDGALSRGGEGERGRDKWAQEADESMKVSGIWDVARSALPEAVQYWVDRMARSDSI